MKRVKTFIMGLLTGAMIVQSAIPALAAVTKEKKFNDGSVYVQTDNGSQYLIDYEDDNYPCWIWKDGYCYYHKNAGIILKNTMTPDGYTVDELGRWTVNGVPQHNGYGTVKMGTDEYIGKSDDEIWSLMQEKLKNTFSNYIPLAFTGYSQTATSDRVWFDGYTYGYGPDKVWFDYDPDTYGGVGETRVNHNTNECYLDVVIGTAWSDIASNTISAYSKAAYSNKPDVAEKTIKAVVGDNIGQELFDYIKKHADKTTSGYIPEYNENGEPRYGKWVIDWSTIADEVKETWFDYGDPLPDKRDGTWASDKTLHQFKSIWVENGAGDGIAAETLDLSAWKNRITDYGKKFDVEPYSTAIKIKVYN